MQNDRENLSERLLELSAVIIKITLKLNSTLSGRHVAGQIVRSATSSGANYEEACAAESRADFVHKMQIALKELRETRYWLKLLTKSFPAALDGSESVLQEAEELIKIFSKSVITAKNPRR